MQPCHARTSLLSVTVLAISPLVVAAGQPAAAEGERIAQQVCSACHVVASQQDRPPILTAKTPSFCEIAHRPETTTQGVARFVLTTHWDEKSAPPGMPNPMLNKDQAGAVARYIRSLKGGCAF